MKTSLLSLSFVVCAFPAFAQEMGEDQRPGPRAASPLMKAIDRNGDGSLQQEEIDMAVVALRGLDTDKDGTVSASELGQGRANRPGGRPEGSTSTEGRPERPERPGQGGQRRTPDFGRLDKDGDGKISKEEAPDRMKERFDMLDGNGDGFIDKAEQAELLKRFRERAQGEGAGRRDRESPAGGVTPKRPEPIE